MVKTTNDLAKSENQTFPNENIPDAQNARLVKPEENASDDDAEMPIQAVKIKADLNITKPHNGIRKGENRTERQKAATAKMKEALALKTQQKREQKAIEDEAHRKALEEKIVKKAISIKKKQIKEQLALDEISDDDTAIEELLPPKRKTPVLRKAVAVAPTPEPYVPPKQRIVFI